MADTKGEDTPLKAVEEVAVVEEAVVSDLVAVEKVVEQAPVPVPVLPDVEESKPVEAKVVIDNTPAAETPAPTATVTATETAPEKKKKMPKFTLPKPTFTPKYYKDVEYQNRDTNNLHPDIRVNFSDVIAEPDGAHSFATIWGTSFKSYSVVKYWTYRILTAVLAVPISVLWGIYFALLAFCSIWCIVPCIKGFIIWTNFIGKIWSLVVRTFLDPLFESIALVFSKIRISMSMRNETAKES